MVLYKVFSKMTDDLDIETIQSLLMKKGKIERMSFGKHSGKLLSEVPKSYVQWLAREGALDKIENAQLKESFEKLGYLTGI